MPVRRFDINSPGVRGTLSVTNAPYAGTAHLNAAAVDVGRNRLVLDNDPNNAGYAIRLAVLTLVRNAATPVTLKATDLSFFGMTGDLTAGTLVIVVPEPASLALLGLAAGVVAAVRLRCRPVPEAA